MAVYSAALAPGTATVGRCADRDRLGDEVVNLAARHRRQRASARATRTARTCDGARCDGGDDRVAGEIDAERGDEALRAALEADPAELEAGDRADDWRRTEERRLDRRRASRLAVGGADDDVVPAGGEAAKGEVALEAGVAAGDDRGGRSGHAALLEADTLGARQIAPGEGQARVRGEARPHGAGVDLEARHESRDRDAGAEDEAIAHRGEGVAVPIDANEDDGGREAREARGVHRGASDAARWALLPIDADADGDPGAVDRHAG